MTDTLDRLVSILDLSSLSEDCFIGENYSVEFKRVFGGQVIAQALVAAQRTVQERRVHSLHSYFLRPGDPQKPIKYEVERIRDGRSFTTRRVVASQDDVPIFSLSASFQKSEVGLEHQFDMKQTTLPDDLLSESELVQQYSEKYPHLKYWSQERPISFKFVDFSHYLDRSEKGLDQNVWFRANGTLTDSNELLHQAILAYASDYHLLVTALIPHGRTIFDPDLMVASLDHSIWFHRPIRIDEWHLYYTESPSSSGSRGFCRGSIYNLEGELVASTAQEGLIRKIDNSKV